MKFARERKQFGKPIAEFDLIRKKIGDIATQTYVAESMAFRTAGLLDARSKAIDPADPQVQKKQIDAIEEHAIEASIIKVFGSEMLHATADETLQIFGGAGYIEDYPIERVSRDARINRIFEGTNEINRLLVPGTMLKRAMKGRLPLMALVGRGAAGAGRSDQDRPRACPTGRWGASSKKCDFAKRAIAYGASLGVQKYMQEISEKQELLGVLADCLILTFGMDSAIARTLQLIAAKGEAGEPDPALHDPAVRRQGPRAGVRHAARDDDVDVAGRGVGPRDARRQQLLQPRSRQHVLAAPQDRQTRHRSRRLRAVAADYGIRFQDGWNGGGVRRAGRRRGCSRRGGCGPRRCCRRS